MKILKPSFISNLTWKNKRQIKLTKKSLKCTFFSLSIWFVACCVKFPIN